MTTQKTDNFMLKLIIAHWIIATFITSLAFNTYLLGFVVGGVISLITYISYKKYQGTRFYKIIIAIALMSFSALFIQQFYGRIELHFHVFIALAFLTAYRDRVPLAIGSTFIALHHFIFNYLQQFNVEIFNTKIVIFNYGCGLDIVFLHAILVIAEWFVLDLTIKGKIKEFDLINKTQNELLEANETIQKEGLKYHSMMKYSSDGIFIISLDGKLQEFSEKAQEMLGYTKEEMQKLYVYEWDISHSKEEALEHVKNTPTQPFTFETKHKRKDGSIYDASISVVRIHSDDKDFIYASVRDITQDKQLQEELTEQKIEFEAIFRNSKDGIALLDLESKFLDFNNAYLEMTGFSREELLSKSGYELATPEDKEKTKSILDEVLKNGYVENFEKSCVVNNNKYIDTNMSITLMPDKKRLLLVAKDVTALKQFEKQSKMASMGEMIGNIAHQWRQPLSIISTASTGVLMYKDMGALTDEIIEVEMNHINNNAQYLSKTIDDFRDFIKGDRQKVEFNLSQDIHSFLNLVQGNIKRYEIDVHLDIEENITLTGYPNELIQCFINIFNNAKDALINLGSERFIFISTYKKDDTVVITFKDNANGIPQDVLPKIFEPYFTTKHQSKGTGLGLSMTYNLIIDGMQGSITANNTQYTYNDKSYIGAEFTIILPL
jgi:PAS domain S-box-containing protein